MKLPPKYEVLAEIGRGGTGRVYRVRHTTLDAVFAIKVLYPHLANDPEIARLFVREARLLAKLSHPHIVRLHDIDEYDDTRFMVMELVEGVDLAKTLASSGALGLDRALKIASEVASALVYAHAFGPGVVHRDIKPSNIILEAETGRSVVTDFGVAKVMDRSEATRQGFKGTLRYGAPEQLRGTTVDGRADVYSLGLVLYEMLAGKAPLAGMSDPEIIGRVLGYGEVIEGFPSTIPDPVREIILRAAAREPEARYESAATFLSALEVVRRGGGSKAGRPAPQRASAPGADPDATRSPGGPSDDATRIAPARLEPPDPARREPDPEFAFERLPDDLPEKSIPAPRQGFAARALLPLAITTLAILAIVGGAYWFAMRSAGERPPDSGGSKPGVGAVATWPARDGVVATSPATDAPASSPTSVAQTAPPEAPQPAATSAPGATTRAAAETPRPEATPRGEVARKPTSTPMEATPRPPATPRTTATPRPAASPGRTATPTPLPAARPTGTPRPTPTPKPTATPTPEPTAPLRPTSPPLATAPAAVATRTTITTSGTAPVEISSTTILGATQPAGTVIPSEAPSPRPPSSAPATLEPGELSGTGKRDPSVVAVEILGARPESRGSAVIEATPAPAPGSVPPRPEPTTLPRRSQVIEAAPGPVAGSVPSLPVPTTLPPRSQVILVTGPNGELSEVEIPATADPHTRQAPVAPAPRGPEVPPPSTVEVLSAPRPPAAGSQQAPAPSSPGSQQAPALSPPGSQQAPPPSSPGPNAGGPDAARGPAAEPKPADPPRTEKTIETEVGGSLGAAAPRGVPELEIFDLKRRVAPNKRTITVEGKLRNDGSTPIERLTVVVQALDANDEVLEQHDAPPSVLPITPGQVATFKADIPMAKGIRGFNVIAAGQ